MQLKEAANLSRPLGPLDGIKVIEFAGLGPAPFACMMLADMGADLLRLERATGRQLKFADDKFDVLARGRSSVAIDLKGTGAAAMVRALVARADVLIDSFRPGVTERLGLGPEDCLAVNQRLVYARSTGWGSRGPLAARAGHDINYLAIAGALSAIGEAGRKPVPPMSLVGDFGGGGMLCVVGVLAALLERGGSGRGQVVEAAMIDGVSTLMASTHGYRSAGYLNDARGGNLLDGGAPYYDTYECLDGEYIAVGAIEPRFFHNFLLGLGLAGDIADQADRSQWPALRDRIAAIVRTRTRAAWAEIFAQVDACVTPVLHLGEAASDPQIAARETLVTIDGVVQPSPAPRFSRTPSRIGRPPRRTGADTIAALSRWGIDRPEIDELIQSGTLAQS